VDCCLPTSLLLLLLLLLLPANQLPPQKQKKRRADIAATWEMKNKKTIVPVCAAETNQKI
jgi:hypothetical protein